MTPEQRSSFREFVLANRGIAILGAIALIAFIAACALGIALLLSLRGGNGLAAATPTPFPETPVAAPPIDESLVVGISDSATVSVTLDVPTTLQVRDRTFAVQTQVISADGVWAPAIQEPGTAVWVYGTIVNYVVGLRDSAENRALLEQLTPGEEMSLTTRAGISYTFAFNSRNLVPTGNRDVFAQRTPGLTLMLLGTTGQERLVVQGRYVVTEASNGAGNVVELGETAQVDDVQVTVSGASYVPGRPEAPPGFAFYQIDLQIQNVGLTALDTSRLQFVLLDDSGNQYAMNALATQLGNFPALSGFLNAGQATQATAGYQIPVGLTSATLSWVITRTDTGSQVQVNIPFTGTGGMEGAAVSLSRAEVSPDFTSLILAGQVANVGNQPVVIGEREVTLRTDDGAVYLLLSTNPPFPWSIAPGQTTQFVVTFQRPAADSATFTILNQPFQLTGLR